MQVRQHVHEEDRSRRRQAVQLVAMLPEDQADALAVLDYAKDLVLHFLEADRDHPVLRLTRPSTGGEEPSTLAMRTGNPAREPR